MYSGQLMVHYESPCCNATVLWMDTVCPKCKEKLDGVNTIRGIASLPDDGSRFFDKDGKIRCACCGNIPSECPFGG